MPNISFEGRLIQTSLSWHADRHTHTPGLIAVPGPLQWSIDAR